MAQYLWQTSLTSSAWKDQVSGNLAALFDTGDSNAGAFWRQSTTCLGPPLANTISSRWWKCLTTRAWRHTSWR